MFSDLHLESGFHLGEVDIELGNSRMRDAERILDQIVSEDCDLLVFAGDMARTALPKPPAYNLLQKALRRSKADRIAFLMGNHDFGQELACCLDVVAGVVPRSRVFTAPKLTDAGGIQLGVLPWTPPSRLFAAAPHDPRRMNQIATDALLAVVRGMAAKIDPTRPSLLVGHWLLGGGKLQTGSEVVEAREPILPVEDLETGPWDCCLFAHNHVHQQIGHRSWHIGPPMVGGFGEQDLEPGYMVVEWPGPDVRFVPTHDRRLLTVDVEAGTAAEMIKGTIATRGTLADLNGAVVRVRVRASEDEAARLQTSGDLREFVALLRAAGAVKVVGPQLIVERAERERRTDLSVEVEPVRALGPWLDQRGVDAGLRPLVEAEFGRVTS